jgi:hypothetical protein
LVEIYGSDQGYAIEFDAEMLMQVQPGGRVEQAPLLKQVFHGLEEAGGVLTEAAIVVLRLGGLIVPTGGPWGWVFCGRRWLPGSVALAPPSEGKDGSGQQPEDSYPAGFFPGDEDDAEGKKSTAGSV